MATTIDIENAKQIRQSMDVIITMTETSSNSANLSNYSSYSYKVANYDSAETTDNAMRLLADLQGEGFPLDGSHYVYESNATDTTGKIGIRGNIGATIGISVTSTSRMNRLSVSVTGCASMTYNGTTYDATTGYVLIPLSAYSANLVFYPAETDRRVEIAYIVPSVNFEITNDNLISCTLELRADLQPIDPTLPQSEIVIEMYSPNDVSDVMADVINELPITYSAGYAGDMSPVRQFYLSEQATWKDNVLTIHGVDAVTKLEKEIDPFYIGHFFYNVYKSYRQIYAPTDQGGHWKLYQAFVDTLKNCGVEPKEEDTPPSKTGADSLLNGNLVRSVVDIQPGRDLIANMMNLLHQDYNAGDFNGFDSYWLTYVDAGIPTVRWRKPDAKWTIQEEDCGDIKREVGRKIGTINAQNKYVRVRAFREDLTNWVAAPNIGPTYFNSVESQAQHVGSVDFIKNAGVAVNAESITDMACFLFKTSPVIKSTGQGQPQEIITKYGCLFPSITRDGYAPALSFADTDTGRLLPEGSTVADCYGKKLLHGETWLPWNKGYTRNTDNGAPSELWRKLTRAYPADEGYATPVEPDAEAVTLDLYGSAYNLDDNPTAYKFGEGVKEEPSSTNWAGFVWARKRDRSKAYQILPDEGFKSLGKRSRETGSFMWKGDPRMQPRDVFEFEKLDGTTEARTVESISLKHEGGGLSAQITYRKGVV